MKKILIKEYTQGEIKTIKAFQDWMDSNHPNWVGCTDSACTNGKNLNKGKGYGTFGPSTTKAWSKWGNDFNTQYNPQSDGGGAAQQSETEDKAKEIFDIYSKKIWFYNKNNVIFNLQEFNKEIGDWINYFISEGFNQPSAFLGAILMNYGTQLTQYKARKNVQDEIDKYLTALQDTLTARLNEGFKLKKLLGLSQILEQVSDFVVVNIVNGIPKKRTEDDNYIDTIKNIGKDKNTLYIPEKLLHFNGDLISDFSNYKDYEYSIDNIKLFLDKPEITTALNTGNFLVNRDTYINSFLRETIEYDLQTNDAFYFSYLWIKSINRIKVYKFFSFF